MTPETDITCKIGKRHEWIPLPKGRFKCIHCKLILHEPGR